MNEIKVYAVKHVDEITRSMSRSGGVFTAISDYILDNNGVVYGCILDEHLEAVHIEARTKKDRDRMRGSKYIQSKLGNVFKSVKNNLDNNLLVLFSGTSCQVAGLKAFLGKEYSNLICVDIVCHGVPSNKVWKKYVGWQEKRHNAICVNVDFRNKKDYGWQAHVESLYMFDSKKNQFVVNSQVFKELFLGDNILRPSCYKCPYKSVIHPSDITIADYWGIDNAAPGFNDNKGVSLVIINNSNGEKIFNNIQDDLIFKECRIEDSLQHALVKPFDKPKTRDKFWKDFSSKSFDFIANKYGGTGLMFKVKRKLHGKLRRN